MEQIEAASTANLNIYQRLLKISEEVKYVQKGSKTVNGQYTFVSHDSITSRCSESFIKNGVYAQPNIINKKIDLIGISRYDKYTKQNISKDNFICEVEVEYTFINVDKPEEKVIVNSIGQGIDDQDKACGKAISYACKYALLKAFSIETGDDVEKDVQFSVDKERVAGKLYNIIDEETEDIIRGGYEVLTSSIIDELKQATSLVTLGDIFKENQKDINRIKKYDSSLYETIIQNKDSLKANF